MRGRGLIISLMAAAVLTSCGTERVDTRGGENTEIGFATHLTRGSEIANAAGVAAEGGFSVWAFQHTGTWSTASDKVIFIDNTGLGYGHVTGNAAGTEWNYGPPKYWPAGKMISFFAYTPHGCAMPDGTDAAGVPAITYEVPDEVANQKDLMIAAPVLDATGPNPVNEVFHHALSRITFSACKADLMPGEVKITTIGLKNIRYRGSTTLQTPVSWAVDTHTYNYALFDDLLLDVTLGAGANAAQNVTAPNGAMFLMPQELNGSEEIIVLFTAEGMELSWSGTIPAPAAWLPGKSYNYRLLIDGDMVVIVCGQLEPLEDGSDWGDF